MIQLLITTGFVFLNLSWQAFREFQFNYFSIFIGAFVVALATLLILCILFYLSRFIARNMQIISSKYDTTWHFYFG